MSPAGFRPVMYSSWEVANAPWGPSSAFVYWAYFMARTAAFDV